MGSIWNYFIGHEVKQTFYQAGGIRTRAIEAGHGEPLIFLHGTGGHAEAYAKNIAVHAPYFHVYAIDMVGHGFTDKPDHLKYCLQDYVDHLHDFVNAIGTDKVHLSGESLGGQVAVTYAYQHPERIHRIVLNTGIVAPRSEKGMQELRDMLERSRNAASALTKETVRKRLQWLMYDQSDVTDELVDIRYRIYSQPGYSTTMLKITEGVVNNESPNRDNSFLQEVKAETLVLWTDHNPGCTWEEAKQAATKLPNHKFYLMKNSAAHWPQWEEPEEFNQVHIEFLRFGL
jgi:2-hydroxy-6-oxonona-2,4-dienedioate hydrolase